MCWLVRCGEAAPGCLLRIAGKWHTGKCPRMFLRRIQPFVEIRKSSEFNSITWYLVASLQCHLVNGSVVPVPLGVRTLLVAFHRVLPLPTTLAWEVTRRLRAVTQTEQDNILTIFVANYRERYADDGCRDGDDDRYQQLDVAVEYLRTVASVQKIRWGWIYK